MIVLIEEKWNGKERYYLRKNMGKGLHKAFKAAVKEILQDLPILGESGLEVPYFIPDTRNFSEVTRFSDDIKKPFLKAKL